LVARWVAACGVALAGGCGQLGEVDPVAPSATRVASDDVPSPGAELIGTVAPELEVDAWIVDGAPAAQPITLASLRGRVVLVRLWTDTCPFCTATAPALVQLDEEFRDRGLVVVGVHHPKPRPAAGDPDVASVEHVARVANDWGIRFPIAIDRGWRTIDRWWLDGGDRSATSASFLIDRAGVIRWVHPGPEYHPGGPAAHAQCRADFAALHDAIEELLG
jgi:thiol-disulfide isomerase/thioredoxin